MEFVVKYSDYNEVISEVEIPISNDQRTNIKLDSVDDGSGKVTNKVVINVVDDTISFNVMQEFTKPELRNLIQVLQKLSNQMV